MSTFTFMIGKTSKEKAKLLGSESDSTAHVNVGSFVSCSVKSTLTSGVSWVEA